MYSGKQKRTGFSLLYTEDREYYFFDFSGTLFLHQRFADPLGGSNNSGYNEYPSTLLRNISIQLGNPPPSHFSLTGRFHLASKNIYFVAADQRYPIFKIPFGGMVQLTPIETQTHHYQDIDDEALGGSSSGGSGGGSSGGMDGYVLLVTNTVTTIIPNNPHEKISLDIHANQSEFVISSSYSSLSSYMRLLRNLFDIENLRRGNNKHLLQYVPLPSSQVSPSSMSTTSSTSSMPVGQSGPSSSSYLQTPTSTMSSSSSMHTIHPSPMETHPHHHASTPSTSSKSRTQTAPALQKQGSTGSSSSGGGGGFFGSLFGWGSTNTARQQQLQLQKQRQEQYEQQQRQLRERQQSELIVPITPSITSNRSTSGMGASDTISSHHSRTPGGGRHGHSQQHHTPHHQHHHHQQPQQHGRHHHPGESGGDHDDVENTPRIDAEALLSSLISLREYSLTFDMSIVNDIREIPLISLESLDIYFIYSAQRLTDELPVSPSMFSILLDTGLHQNTPQLVQHQSQFTDDSGKSDDDTVITTDASSTSSLLPPPTTIAGNQATPATSSLVAKSSHQRALNLDEHIRSCYSSNAFFPKYHKMYQQYIRTREVLVTGDTTASQTLLTQLITPLISVPGRLLLSGKYLYYVPFNDLSADTYNIALCNIVSLHKRRYAMRECGLEIVVRKSSSSSAGGTGSGAGATSSGSGLPTPPLSSSTASIQSQSSATSSPAIRLDSFASRTTRPESTSALSTISSSSSLTNTAATMGDELPFSYFDHTFTLYFAFDSPFIRDYVYDLICIQPGYNATSHLSLSDCTNAWCQGKMSNFDYLLLLNHFGGRSFCDLSQYPIMPWVIQDFVSDVLDLDNPEVFRDLTKPMGALNPERLTHFRSRYQNMVQLKQQMKLHDELHGGDGDGSHDGGNTNTGQGASIDPYTLMTNTDPFMYGTHYSTPGYIVHYLVRSHPLLFLKLQGGTFDKPERLFSSIAGSWVSATQSHADVRELIPQFYDIDGVTPDSKPVGGFLTNQYNLDLGTLSTTNRDISDVVLPPWADNPYDFIAKLRRALEHPHVTHALPAWIDLIFGVKQTGDAAVEADNVFFPLTYEGAVDLDAIAEPSQQKLIETQLVEFGQVPKQLFKSSHPVPGTSSIDWAELFVNPAHLNTAVLLAQDDNVPMSMSMPVPPHVVGDGDGDENGADTQHALVTTPRRSGEQRSRTSQLNGHTPDNDSGVHPIISLVDEAPKPKVLRGGRRKKTTSGDKEAPVAVSQSSTPHTTTTPTGDDHDVDRDSSVEDYCGRKQANTMTYESFHQKHVEPKTGGGAKTLPLRGEKRHSTTFLSPTLSFDHLDSESNDDDGNDDDGNDDVRHRQTTTQQQQQPISTLSFTTDNSPQHGHIEQPPSVLQFSMTPRTQSPVRGDSNDPDNIQQHLQLPTATVLNGHRNDRHTPGDVATTHHSSSRSNTHHNDDTNGDEDTPLRWTSHLDDATFLSPAPSFAMSNPDNTMVSSDATRQQQHHQQQQQQYEDRRRGVSISTQYNIVTDTENDTTQQPHGFEAYHDIVDMEIMNGDVEVDAYGIIPVSQQQQQYSPHRHPRDESTAHDDAMAMTMAMASNSIGVSSSHTAIPMDSDLDTLHVDSVHEQKEIPFIKNSLPILTKPKNKRRAGVITTVTSHGHHHANNTRERRRSASQQPQHRLGPILSYYRWVWKSPPRTQSLPVKIPFPISQLFVGTKYTLVLSFDGLLRVFCSTTLVLRRQAKVSALPLSSCALLDATGTFALLGDNDGYMYLFNADVGGVIQQFTSTQHSHIFSLMASTLSELPRIRYVTRRATQSAEAEGGADQLNDDDNDHQTDHRKTKQDKNKNKNKKQQEQHQGADIPSAFSLYDPQQLPTSNDSSLHLYSSTTGSIYVASVGTDCLRCWNINLRLEATSDDHSVASLGTPSIQPSPVCEVLTHNNVIVSMCFTSDNRYLVSLDNDGLLVVTDIVNNDEDGQIDCRHYLPINHEYKPLSFAQSLAAATVSMYGIVASQDSTATTTATNLLSLGQSPANTLSESIDHQSMQSYTYSSLYIHTWDYRYEPYTLDSSHDGNDQDNGTNDTNDTTISSPPREESTMVMMSHYIAITYGDTFVLVNPRGECMTSHDISFDYGQSTLFPDASDSTGRDIDGDRGGVTPRVYIVGVIQTSGMFIVGYSNGFIRAYSYISLPVTRGHKENDKNHHHQQDIANTATAMGLITVTILWQKQIANQLFTFNQTVLGYKAPFLTAETLSRVNGLIYEDNRIHSKKDGASGRVLSSSEERNDLLLSQHYTSLLRYSILAGIKSTSTNTYRLCCYRPLIVRDATAAAQDGNGGD